MDTEILNPFPQQIGFRISDPLNFKFAVTIIKQSLKCEARKKKEPVSPRR
jgi:hypothetical protein